VTFPPDFTTFSPLSLPRSFSAKTSFQHHDIFLINGISQSPSSICSYFFYTNHPHCIHFEFQEKCFSALKCTCTALYYSQSLKHGFFGWQIGLSLIIRLVPPKVGRAFLRRLSCLYDWGIGNVAANMPPTLS